MTLALLLAGFNRSLSHTWPGIKANVIAPLEEFGIDLQVYGAISRSRDPIENKWSNEVGHSEWDVPEPDRFTTLKYFEQWEIDRDMNQMYEIAQLAGDPWPEVNDNFASLRNHMRFLYLLKVGYQLIPKDVTSIFFLRPDLLPTDRVQPESYFEKNENGFVIEKYSGVVIPDWQHWTGYNDRLAIISRPFWRTYLSRYDDIPARVQSGYAIHSETYLKHCLRDTPVFPVLKEFFARVRVNGTISPYDAKNSKSEISGDWAIN